MAVRPSPPVFLALATALVVAWSSGFVGIRFSHDSASVPQILFARSLFSGLGLLPFLIGPWGRGPAITARELAEQGLFAFLGMFLYLGGFAMGIGAGVPTGLVALMADLVPLGIAALSAPMLGQGLTGRQWLGTGIACAGVLATLALGVRWSEWGNLDPIPGFLAAVGLVQAAQQLCVEGNNHRGG